MERTKGWTALQENIKEKALKRITTAEGENFILVSGDFQKAYEEEIRKMTKEEENFLLEEERKNKKFPLPGRNKNTTA